RQFVAMVGIAGSLLSSVVAGIPVALVDEKIPMSNSAFLTVQPVTLDEKDNDSLLWQNNIFVTVNKTWLAVPAVKTVAQTKKQVVTVTAYSSTPDQTDSSPFITANGTYVRDGIIAANFLPFGAKVKFPEYMGDKIYTVEDRMAKKNSHKIDIWMSSRELALEFGVKRLAVEIFE
ncbi:3D domain-containing protein, partial [Patescibacteria group bacterium]|nr:3D domain-containing protein [Patescibacteria group bacterium]